MPDFDGNPLIQALDAKRKAAEEAEACAPRVFCITDGKPYQPPKATRAKRARKAKKPAIDTGAVQVLEDALDQAKKGLLRGATVLGRRPHGGFALLINLPADSDSQSEACAYVGGLEMLKGVMLDIAENGLEAVHEAQELEGDEE